jgi:hypothetical protein
MYGTNATNGCTEHIHIVLENQKGKVYAFKDFMLDWVQEMTDPAQTAGNSDNTQG